MRALRKACQHFESTSAGALSSKSTIQVNRSSRLEKQVNNAGLQTPRKVRQRLKSTGADARKASQQIQVNKRRRPSKQINKSSQQVEAPGKASQQIESRSLGTPNQQAELKLLSLAAAGSEPRRSRVQRELEICMVPNKPLSRGGGWFETTQIPISA